MCGKFEVKVSGKIYSGGGSVWENLQSRSKCVGKFADEVKEICRKLCTNNLCGGIFDDKVHSQSARKKLNTR